MEKHSIKFGDKVLDTFNFNPKLYLIPIQLDTINENSLLYLSQGKSNCVDGLIKENIDWICSQFNEHGFNFIYTPQIFGTLIENYAYFKETVKYEYPYYDEKKLKEIHSLLNTEAEYNSNKFLYDFAPIIIEITHNYYLNDTSFSCLLIRNGEFDATLIVLPKAISENELKELFTKISNYLYRKKLAIDLFSLDINSSTTVLYDPQIIDENYSDENFDLEVVKKNFEDCISILKRGGYSNLIFEILNKVLEENEQWGKQVFNKPKQVILSKIIIDKEFRIFLPAYNNEEVVLTPLPKAIFLLFLNHPKGIIFKHLPKYKDELYNIYKKIHYRETSEEIEKSIQDATDPFNNSINEKCAKIKKVFTSMFDDSIAKYYYITGERGKEKLIKKALTFNVDTSIDIIDTSSLF